MMADVTPVKSMVKYKCALRNMTNPFRCEAGLFVFLSDNVVSDAADRLDFDIAANGLKPSS